MHSSHPHCGHTLTVGIPSCTPHTLTVGTPSLLTSSLWAHPHMLTYTCTFMYMHPLTPSLLPSFLPHCVPGLGGPSVCAPFPFTARGPQSSFLSLSPSPLDRAYTLLPAATSCQPAVKRARLRIGPARFKTGPPVLKRAGLQIGS